MSAGKRSTLRVFAVVMLVLVLPPLIWLVASALVNSVDVELSADGKALLKFPVLPEPNERNAYVSILGLGAAAEVDPYAQGLKVLAALKAQDQPGFSKSSAWREELDRGQLKSDKSRPICKPEEKSCLELAATKPEVEKHVAEHQGLLERYRGVRSRPQYVGLYAPAKFDSALPNFGNLTEPQNLALLSAALRANSGDLEGVVAELEAENAFHRRVAAGGGALIAKMVAVTMLSRDALFVSDLVREKSQAIAPFRARLQALVRPLTPAETELATVLQQENAALVNWLSGLRFDSGLQAMLGNVDLGIWPSLWYRPNQTINLTGAYFSLARTLLHAPAARLRTDAAAVSEKQRALKAGGISAFLRINRTGERLVELLLEYESTEEQLFLPYVSRIHDLGGLYSLVALQIKLDAAGVREPDAVAAALAGPLGAEFPDPWTGKPMVFDAKRNTVGFETRSTGLIVGSLKKRFGGRVAVAL